MATTYESAIKVGAEIARNLTPDALKAARALKQLAKDTKALKAAEAAAKAHKKLNEAVAASKAKYDQAAAALRKLEEAEKAAGGATKESTKWRKAGEREVAKYAREVDRATKAAEANSRALQKFGVDSKRLAHEQARLAAAGRFAAARDRLFGAPREKGPLLTQARDQFRGVAHDAMMLGTVAAGAGAGLIALVTKVGNAGDAAAKMAKRVGIGVEALQELRYAGEREGASAEDVDHALGKLAINIGKFKNAKGKAGGGAGGAIPGLELLSDGKQPTGEGALNPFKMLGLDAKKLSAMKPEEQVGKIADAMKKIKTHADKAAVAQAIFGREVGLKFLPMLEKGATGIAGLRQEAQDLGHVISKDAALQAEEFNDRMLDATLAAKGMANTLGVALLPVVTKTFTDFTNYVKTNRAEIQAWIKNAATWIQNEGLPALMSLARGAGSVVKSLVELGKWLNDHVPGGLKTVAISIAALRLAPLVTTLGQIALEAGKATAAMLRFAAANNAAGGGGPGALPGTGGGGFGFAKALPFVGLAVAGGEWLANQKVPGMGDLNVGDLANPGALGTAAGQDKLRGELARRFEAQGGGGSNHFDIRPQIVVGSDGSREYVAAGMDQAKQRVLEEYDRRRLSFNE